MRVTLTILIVCLSAYVGTGIITSFKDVIDTRNEQLCTHHPDFC